MAKERLSGKLAVILHADVAGSTRLVQQDEQLAHERIQDAFRRFGDTISKYYGQVRELRGDALLAEFERASDAVTAALAFQAEQNHYNAQLNDSLQPTVRVGIAMGEVVIADNTITGTGVVLAQRLEQLADTGGVVIQGAAYETIPGRFPFEFVNLGEHEAKGFEEPVRVYSANLKTNTEIPPPESVTHKIRNTVIAFVSLAVVIVGVALIWVKPWEIREAPASLERMAFPLPSKPSIAVLPFTDMSNDEAQEYFADGITEDLTTDLSKISGLFVVARNSSFSYKGNQVDVRTIAKELGVRYVLEGSVRRINDQVRINAQLVDGVLGGHIWAERFDGNMANIFALQDHVNREIVSALEVTLTDEDQKAFDQVETNLPEAYDTFLRGLEQYQLFSSESMIRARGLFEEAIKKDPNYARAYANIALTHAAEVNFQWTQDRNASIREGLEYAKSALALDDSIPQGYLARSFLYLSQREHLAAIEAANRTLEVYQNYADGHATLAFILSFSGKLEAALMALNRAKQLNPQATGVYMEVEGRILFLLERYNSAVEVLEKSVERNPALDRSHLTLAAAYAALGQIDEAAWSVEEALAINSHLTLERERHESLYLRDRDINHYIDALRKAGVPES